jgi:hypothetical protein
LLPTVVLAKLHLLLAHRKGVPFSLDPSDFSPVYLVEPIGTTSAVRINIVVPWSSANGDISRELALYAAKQWGELFQRVSDSYTNTGFMQASITQFGVFFAGYPKTAAQPIALESLPAQNPKMRKTSNLRIANFIFVATFATASGGSAGMPSGDEGDGGACTRGSIWKATSTRIALGSSGFFAGSSGYE